MAKQTLVTANFQTEVIDINNEAHLKIVFTGIPLSNYKSKNRTWAKANTLELYMPLEYTPYMMRLQRESVAKWEKRKLEFIQRIKSAYNQPVTQPEKPADT